MPTLYGHSTSVQLSVANLARATTQNPEPRQCSVSTANIKKIDLEFAKASRDGTLGETALLGDDGRHLRFLGKHEDMPFFMVRAGKDFFDPNAMEKTTRRPARSVRTQMSDNITLYDSGLDEIEEAANLSRAMAVRGNKHPRPPMEPHALCLTVFLSKASFFQTTYKNHMKLDVKHDIKIDVYFNGQFFASQVMGAGQLHYTGSRGIKVRMHRFTGQKLSRFIEKPWIFVPPGHQPDGCRRASFPAKASMSEILANAGAHRRASAPVNASKLENLEAEPGNIWRWSTIASRLMEEADQVGRDRHGERPVTGEYLECLASLPAPLELKDMQKAGGASFGVIDVVMIWGKGQKDAAGSKYLTEPTRLRLKSYSAESNGDMPREEPQIQNKRVQTPATNPSGVSPLATFAHKADNVSVIIPASNIDSDALSRPTPQPNSIPITTPIPDSNTVHTATATPQPILPPQTRSEALATALTVDGSGDTPPKPTLLKELHPTPQNRQRTSSTSTTRQPSVTSTRKPTPKRSRETSISSETSNPSKRPRMPYYHVMTAKQTRAEEMESIVEQAVEEAEMLTANAGLTVARAGMETLDTSLLSTASEEVSLVETTTPMPSKVVTLKISPPKLASSPLRDGALAEDGAATPHKRGSVASNASTTRWFDAHFVPPALSEDCCVTFAERGVVRSVGAVRGGWFEEGGVLMGTRFIIG